MSTEENTIKAAILDYTRRTWGTEPEYLWARNPDTAVLRHRDTKKWYGIFMRVSGDKLGEDADEICDILNVRCDPVMIGGLREQPGFYPAYHMNKEYWVSILLDGSVPEKQIRGLLALSFSLTEKAKSGAEQPGVPAQWMVPANPAYFDVEKEFEEREIIRWKQRCRVKVGDIVYIYMGMPVGSVLFRCEVVETDIPCRKQQGAVHYEKLMRIRLLHKYAHGEIDRNFMRRYGVYAVRSARHVPAALARELEQRSENAQKTQNGEVRK